MKKFIYIILTLFFLIYSFQHSFATNKTISIVSYNAGLAHTYVPLSNLRKPRIIKALRENSADVVCLEEVLQIDVPDFIESLKEVYPYFHHVETKQKYASRAPVCSPFDLFGSQKFVSCVISKCRKKSSDAFTNCVIGECREPFEKLKTENNDCAAALIAQVGAGIFKALLTVFNPFTEPGLFMYGGSTGLLLLSKHPLEKKFFLDFTDTSTSVARGVLYAQAKIYEKNYHLFCTHLTPDISHIIPYTGRYKNWSFENKSQAERIVAFANKNIGDEAQIIAGDFNHGKSNATVGRIGELEDNYPIWQKYGYIDPFEREDVKCSWCKENTLIENEKDKKNTLIDHIFFKNINNLKNIKTKIIFDEIIQVTNNNNKLSTNLSDHYGVNIELNLD
jgi:endonuclease/exonuclease/phosphatase family metal-dependent hydrolase